MGMDRPGTDTRVENADNPQPPDHPPAPPPDRPGAPGSRSRIADRRAANEGALAETEARQTALQESRTGENDEQRRDEATSSFETTGEEQDATAGAETADEDREVSESGAEASSATGEVKGQDERGEDPRDQEDGEPLEETRDDSDQPEIPKQDGEDSQDQQSLPDQDDQTSETDKKPEALAEPQTTEAGRVDRPGEEPATEHVSQTEVEPTDQDEPAPVPADEQDGGADPQLPAEGGAHQIPEDLSRTDETTDQPNTQQIQLAWPPAQEGVTRLATPVLHFDQARLRNLRENRDRNAEGQPETPATTDNEPNKFSRLPDRALARTADRGEPIPPEEDPADRNPFKPDPERGQRNRWENFDRSNTAFSATKNILKGVKDLQAKAPPTGHAETRSGANIHRPDVHVGNPTDMIGNGIIFTAAALGGILSTYRNFKSSQRSAHAYNR
ncbi:hypothetical protein ACQPZP_20005 [Spirillospora sp. CA-142024]|uniref:hypothetical protein n=1 Tax=Spirillospora sp. CA-142024 TaxID=3240036 RepID=UPI003D9283CF